MLRFCSLASGSAGNATLIEAGDGLRTTRVLVDCGMGWRQLLPRLAQIGLAPGELHGIFLTHEHGDHVGCAPQLAQRFGVPLWSSAGTLQGLRLAGYEGPAHVARDGDTFAIGALQVQPFTVPHDSREPLQLRCSDGDRALGILTDLGHVTTHVLTQLQGCHALMLESNHDPDLLARSSYPPFLQRRVAGQHGHLSNGQAAAALGALKHDRLNIVVAAHLSERNNRPELVQEGFAAVMGCTPKDVLIALRHGLDAGWVSA